MNLDTTASTSLTPSDLAVTEAVLEDLPVQEIEAVIVG